MNESKDSQAVDYKALIGNALLKIESLESQLKTVENKKKEPIAIIGMSCRFPGGANSPEAFWEILNQGVDTISQVPQDRWNLNDYYDPNPDAPGKIITPYGGFVSQVDSFDAHFFCIAPREVESLDPQQRVLLEVSWEAIERANIHPDNLLDSQTGVFIGICANDYLFQVGSLQKLGAYWGTGNALSASAGRLSYLLGLTGPSLIVDTACSSSLISVHLACQSIRNGECNLALAGGVNLLLSPQNSIAFSKAKMLSPDGRCKTFDAAANGYVRGEGCGIIVLRPLSDAVANGDNILAVIRGSAINQDGASGGLTVPNGPSQQKVIRQALENGGVDPASVSYIEAHGTGTSLGDPIEVGAIGAVFGKTHSQDKPVTLGTVKTNIGHLEGAAGIAGLMKVVLQLQNEKIAPSLHFHEPNPYINWDQLPVKVSTKIQPWEINAQSRIAGISSFGFTGTNSHIVLAETPTEVKNKNLKVKSEDNLERSVHILSLSAKTEKALADLVNNYQDYLEADNKDNELADICYTANIGRADFDHRLAFISSHRQELVEKFKQYKQGENVTGICSGQLTSKTTTKIAFLFTGQGSQYVQMGRQLYNTQPTFKKIIDQCSQILEKYLEVSLLDVLYPDDETSTLIDQTAYTQPAIFALEYALAKLWESWGVKPDIVMGHSVGEYVAATVAGIFSLEDGLKLIAARGRLMQQLPAGGEMVAVMASASTVENLLGAYTEKVGFAAINGPQSVVISGESKAVREIVSNLESEKIKTKQLQVSNAFHSPLMEPMLAEWEAVANQLTYNQPKIPVVSNVTGKIADESITTAKYWVDHVRLPVRFAQGMKVLQQEGYEIFLEIGPKPILLGMGRRCLPDNLGEWLPSLRPNKIPLQSPLERGNSEDAALLNNEWQQMLSSLGKLYVNGVKVDWLGFDQHYSRQKVLLPTYPFQREQYWIENNGQQGLLGKQRLLKTFGSQLPIHPLLGYKINIAAGQQKIFESFLGAENPEYLKDHQVFAEPLLPTTAYLEMALAAGKSQYQTPRIEVKDLSIERGLVLSEGEKVVQTILTPLEENDTYQFQIFSQQEEGEENQKWILHAAGKIQQALEVNEAKFEREKYLAECSQSVEVEQHYQSCEKIGISYGPCFQRIEQLWKGDNQAIAKISLAEEMAANISEYNIHPVILDAALQVIFNALPVEDNRSQKTYLPVGVDQLTTYNTAELSMYAYASVDGAGAGNWKADVILSNEEGKIVAKISGLRVKAASKEALIARKEESITNLLYEVEWRTKGRFGKLLPPEYLLAPKNIEQQLQPTIIELIAQAQLESYQEIPGKLEELTLEYVLQAIKELGWNYEAGDSFESEKESERLGIVPIQKRLFKRMLQMMAESGIIEVVVGSNTEWNVLQTLDEQQKQGEKRGEELLDKYPEAGAELTLLNRCASKLSLVLRGETDPVQLVFPSGDLSTATRVYQDSTVAKLMNTVVEKAIATAIEKLPRAQGVRLLEIGAGTGGTTSYILPNLPENNAEYIFTDLGALFTAKAKERFGDYPFVDYQILDIEADPTTQGYNAHQYDVIIAANVLHATANLKETLSNVRKLLAPGGILVLFELTSRQRWLDLVFGLLEGWWRFQDLEIRPDYPLLSRSKWQEILHETGFTEVVTLPEVEGMPEVLYQQSVIVAQNTTVLPPSSESKNWLILADKQGVAENLATQLQFVGDVPILVFAGDKYQQVKPGEFTINPDNLEDFQQLIGSVSPLYGVIQCWTTETGGSEKIDELSRYGCGTTLSLVQALVQGGLSQPPRLWLVTSGSQPVPSSNSSITKVAQSSLWGMGKVISLEHPELNCGRIDLDPEETIEIQANALFNEIWSEDKEDQVGLRGDSRYVARLVASHHQQLVATGELTIPSQPYKLGISEKGSLDSLILEPINRNSPAAGEVEIQVMATGLNFLDLVATLGLVPDEVDGVSQRHLREMDRFGGECAGYVVAVGEEVNGLEIGDEVIAMAQGSFSQYVTVNASYVVPKPENITFAEAASIPANFLTAYYALHHIAKITKGERILIHAAAGGTGMAAVQIAQKAGAEVFATASPPKWETLRQMGVKYIMNSRTVEFAEQVMEFTQGQGVDIVLNSLTSGDFVSKGLSVVSPQGRFVEIAKRGVWTSGQVSEVRPDISYSVVDLLRKSQEEPELINSMLQELTADFSKSLLKSPPLKVFPIEEVIGAFRYMQQAKHIGKIVVTQPKQEPDKPVSFRDDAAYLITGGMGDMGLLISRWMISKGAKNLVLVGRSRPNEMVKEKIAELETAGASVTVEKADVSDWEAMKGVIERIYNSNTPLAGVMHSVGVLSDGVLQNQTWSSFEKVMSPKVYGSWYLHQLTQNQPLDFFLLFSSAASLFGSSGQANHSAANAFLDGLAHYRRGMKLPGLSIHWSTVSQIGEAAAIGADVRLQKQGVGAITPAQVLESLEVLMSGKASRDVEVGIVPIEWSAWQDRVSKWRFLADWQKAVAGVVATETKLLEQLKESSPEEQEKILVDYLKGKVANILGMTGSQTINIEESLTTMGLDSLMAVELRNLIQRELGFDIPIQTIIEGISISEIVDLVSEQLLLEKVSYSNTSPTEEINEDMEEITL
ncbi:MAG: SDR family NAD(P)-dependent oxidoreductase [Trichodesmium sp. MAG_R01]|nr:SDR family NAD(P)-dependent oxidoreductase [Trichodesmium sp. MAG_R01]